MIKGEIWWANLPDNPYESEPGKRRPVLMLPKNYIVKINESIKHVFDAA